LVITSTGRRRHRSKIPMAMAENLVTRLQAIVLHGSDQDVLRLAALANDIFKPGKHDKNGSNGGPFPATFIRPVPSEPAPAETPAQEPTSAPGTLLKDGQEYVAG